MSYGVTVTFPSQLYFTNNINKDKRANNWKIVTDEPISINEILIEKAFSLNN